MYAIQVFYSQREVGGEDGAKNGQTKEKNVFLSLHVQLIKDLFR